MLLRPCLLHVHQDRESPGVATCVYVTDKKSKLIYYFLIEKIVSGV